MSSGEELPGGEQSPRRLSQIFEPLVDFHKSAQAKAVQKTNPGSSRLTTNSSSTPNSPRLFSKRNKSLQSPPTAAFIASPSLLNDNAPSSWSHFAELTEQINNYQQEISEINWQERCLELQLELHRSRNQAGRIRDMLKEKVAELERRLIEAQQRSDDAQRQVLVMEQKFCDWPNYEKHTPDTDTEKTLKKLENQVEEQKLLRLQDAKQVEAKAAKIKEWVTNKLRYLEDQNQLLREENIKYHQKIESFQNHITSSQNSRTNSQQTRASFSLNVRDCRERSSSFQQGEFLDSPGSRSLEPDLKYYHNKKVSMEPQELTRDLASAIDDLTITPVNSQNAMTYDAETTHDYAEIYTPSVEKTQDWLTDSSFKPTPPMHRYPSWEAKIYQVAKEGLTGSEGDTSLHSTDSASKQEPRSQVTSYCDINVPVYATVKGRASQIRNTPFGDPNDPYSTDDSSDGDEHVTSTHNSSSTENSENSASGPATSPSKNQRVSVNQSPVKKIRSESPKAKLREKTTARDETIEVDSISSDYAIPPDAMSENEVPPVIESVIPAVLLRSSYVDSPVKKVEVSEKSGHLIKLSGKLKTWRKRYFTLKDSTLTYWKSQHDVNRKPQGQIHLDDKCRVSREEGASTFEINTGKKMYYLTADSNASMDDWVKTLQNVQRRNATKLLLSRDDQKPTVQGWVTKVKNGHAKRCWCVLLGRMFLYFKSPGETSPTGEINMRDAKVEEVEHISDDSDEDTRDETPNQAKITVAIFPQHQGPTYLIFTTKQERDNWLYHLTVVSGGARNAGTQYEQLIQKLMEVDGDETSVIWRHPVLLHVKESLTSPLTSLETEALQVEAIKLFKSCQLFMSVAINQPAIDYHVVLAQNALQVCLDNPKLQTELICILIKQTSPHSSQKLSAGVQQLLLCATQSLFTCDSSQQGFTTQANNNTSPPTHQASLLDCKTNPPTYSFVQGWQLLALAVSLFVPKNNRLLWYLKLHLSRHSDSKTENGKYAIYCERALGRCTINGDREAKPSRMEVLSILLKNPYHHSLPHAIPVHFANGTYQVCGFDGSTTIEEFQVTLIQEVGCRDATNGFTLFSDDPIEKDLEHFLDPQAKVCDVISKWETALREKGSGKFENSRVVQLTYKNRLYWKNSTKLETDKERLLLVYQSNNQIVHGRFPLSKELALELASLMAQIDFGDCTSEKLKSSPIQALDRFYPYRYRDTLSPEALKELQELLTTKWMLLKGKSVVDCVRIYLTCARKWQFFGAALFQAQPRFSDMAMAWIAVAEDALSVLELSSMTPMARHSYDNILTFGGHLDDFMLVVSSDDESNTEKKFLFALSKPKILELTMLIADYMNALGHTLPGTPKANTLTRNNSHRSIKSRVQYVGSQANDTLNSYNSLALSSHGQPDILKSTPDHQKSKKN